MVSKENCCGCGACVQRCPHGCISFSKDDEGFYYPIVDKSRCTHCGVCEKVCPALQNYKEELPTIAYACINKNSEIQKESSSGGVFTSIAQYILSKQGVVIGAALDERFSVRHLVIDQVDELYKLRGSKYVQSNIMDIFSETEKYLSQGRMVLFSGTSCQVAALKCFLRKDYENLICVDVVCHGVGSPGIYEQYLDEIQNEAKSRIADVRFRDKTVDWIKFSMKISFESGECYCRPLSEDSYLQGFIANLYLRPSCYECKYKSGKCCSDFSIADYWGIKKIVPNFFDPMGVSMVLLHTKKAEEIFDGIRNDVECAITGIDDAIRCNPAIIASATRPRNRAKFYKAIKRMSFVDAVDYSLKPSILNKINVAIHRMIRKK